MASYVVSVVGPGSELHEAALSVEWKILDIYLARALIDGRRIPHDATCAVDDGLCHDSHLVVAVRTETHTNEKSISSHSC